MSEDAPPAPDAPQPAAPWGLSGAIGMPLLYIGAQILLGLLLGAMALACFALMDPGLIKDQAQLKEALVEVTILPLIVVSSAIILLLVYLSVTVVHKRSFLTALRIGRPTSAGVLGSVALGIAVMLLYGGLFSLFPPEPGSEPGGPLSSLTDQGPFRHAVWTLIAVLIAPLVEETLFRGYSFLGAREKIGPFWAGLCVTTVFVLLHLPETGTYWPALAALSLLAALLVLLIQRTGNLTYCICCHVGYNGAMALLSWIS